MTALPHPVTSLLDRWVVEGREPGAAVCVVRKGETVVDHVAGTRDGERPWQLDTLVMTYSVAKPFAALTVLDVIASGDLTLETRVAEVWPEYATHGKQATTVRQVLSHTAGLPLFPEAAASVAFDDAEQLTALLADTTPDHELGDAVAEHALTYGHLCSALVRGATGEDLAERFARITAEQEWDLHLRVPASELGRVADVVPLVGWPDTCTKDPLWGPALGRPPGLLDPDLLNSARFRTCSFPAIALHASARGLARFYSDLMPLARRPTVSIRTAAAGGQQRQFDQARGSAPRPAVQDLPPGRREGGGAVRSAQQRSRDRRGRVGVVADADDLLQRPLDVVALEQAGTARVVGRRPGGLQRGHDVAVGGEGPRVLALGLVDPLGPEAGRVVDQWQPGAHVEHAGQHGVPDRQAPQHARLAGPRVRVRQRADLPRRF